MKTSTSEKAGTGPAESDKPQARAGSPGGTHGEAPSGGTANGDRRADEAQPVYVHDGITQADLSRLARKVAPTKKVRLADGSGYQMDVDGQWIKLHDPPVDLYAIKVSWQFGVSSELRQSTLGEFLDHTQRKSFTTLTTATWPPSLMSFPPAPTFRRPSPARPSRAQNSWFPSRPQMTAAITQTSGRPASE